MSNKEAQDLEQEKLINQLENAENLKKKQQAEDQRKHQDELQEIEKNIIETEERIKLAEKDAEIELLNQRMESMKKIKSLKRAKFPIEEAKLHKKYKEQ